MAGSKVDCCILNDKQQGMLTVFSPQKKVPRVEGKIRLKIIFT